MRDGLLQMAWATRVTNWAGAHAERLRPIVNSLADQTEALVSLCSTRN